MIGLTLAIAMQGSALPVGQPRNPVPPALLQAIAARFPVHPAPQVVPLQCLVDMPWGVVRTCVPLDGSARLSDAEFEARRASARASRSYTLADAATQIASATGIARDTRAREGTTRMVRIDPLVDMSGIVEVAPVNGPALVRSDVTFQPGAIYAHSALLYPGIALREGVGARMVATCRVLIDTNITCYRAEFAESQASAALHPSIAVAFASATLQLFEGSTVGPIATNGSATAGRDIELGVAWTLP